MTRRPDPEQDGQRVVWLYKTVLLPKITYGIDTWYRPISKPANGKRRTGSVSALKQLTKTQRTAALAITGALKTTATDVLDIHAGLHPMELTLHKACQRAALRMATLPETHPLFKPIKQSAKKIIKKHAGPLHFTMALCPHQPAELEKIEPTRRRPTYKIPAKIIISASREESKRRDGEDNAEARIYTDGSALEGGVGAAAVMYRHNREPQILKYHLGSTEHYTVANAEAIGACLAIHLINKTITCPRTITLNIDSQATIKGLNIKKPRPGQYLIETFLTQLNKMKKANMETRIKINWITAHDGVKGNEKADELAKEAARGNSDPQQRLPNFLRKGSLPISISATKQQLMKNLTQRWITEWENSPRYRRLGRYDDKLPNCKFIQKTKSLPRKHISLLTQLRTGHAPLQKHLHRINKVDSPKCPACQNGEEDLAHYILECPVYRRQRFLLKLKAGRNARNLQYLLSTKKGMKQLLQFIGQTNRFHNTYGSLDLDNNKDHQEQYEN